MAPLPDVFADAEATSGDASDDRPVAYDADLPEFVTEDYPYSPDDSAVSDANDDAAPVRSGRKPDAEAWEYWTKSGEGGAAP